MKPSENNTPTPQRNKVVIYILIAIAVVVGLGIFVGGMTLLTPVLDNYFKENKEIVSLYDFYDAKVGENTTAVYFIGSCHIVFSVYPKEINRILKERGYGNITVYSLYSPGDLPLDRLLHLKKIINSKPSYVIYGMSEGELASNGFNEDHVLIVHDRLEYDDEMLQFYTDEQKNTIRNKNLWDMKRFFTNAIKNELISSERGTPFTNDYFTDPIGGPEIRKEYEETRKAAEFAETPEPNSRYYNITESSRSFQAFKYILDKMNESSIKTSIVNTPSNPSNSAAITEASRENYFQMLNSTGYPVYDLENSLESEYYVYGDHYSFDGAMKLAPAWADIIIKEVDTNDVHNA